MTIMHVWPEAMDEDYVRVVPRDLFNEGDLLNCHGRLVIALEEIESRARFLDEDVRRFEILQSQASGGIVIANVRFEIDGILHRLERPLNSRRRNPLMVEAKDGDPDFEPVRVFEEDGTLTADMLELIGAA